MEGFDSAAQPERIVLTYDDYVQLPDGARYELLEGEIVLDGIIPVARLPSWVHQTTMAGLLVWLSRHVQQHGLGEVCLGPLDVHFDETTGVQPDLVFIAWDRLSIIQADGVRGAPDLIVEVVAPRTEILDRRVKRQLYGRYGVRYYWLFDPDRRAAEAYMLEGSNYRLVATASGGQSFTAPPFPDLTISLSEGWE